MTKAITIDIQKKTIPINMSNQVKVMTPTDHKDLQGLDFNSSGHTGFASEEELNNLKEQFNNLEIDSVIQMKGAEMEDHEFEDGDIVYCTENSDSFTKGSLYYASEDNIIKISGTTVSLEPAILSFSMTGASGTKEVGSTTTLSNYSFTLKKYSKFSSLNITKGSTVLVNNITPNASVSQTTSVNVSNTTTGTITITLTGSLTAGGTKTKSVSYSVASRQYYGILANNPNVETLTSELATNGFGSITSSSVSNNQIKTLLQTSLPSSITLELEEGKPTYVWLIIPTNLTINKAMSGGFDFPYIQQDNITIQNSYGKNIEYKVYRSKNQIYGTTKIDIN